MKGAILKLFSVINENNVGYCNINLTTSFPILLPQTSYNFKPVFSVERWINDERVDNGCFVVGRLLGTDNEGWEYGKKLQ